MLRSHLYVIANIFLGRCPPSSSEDVHHLPIANIFRNICNRSSLTVEWREFLGFMESEKLSKLGNFRANLVSFYPTGTVGHFSVNTHSNSSDNGLVLSI